MAVSKSELSSLLDPPHPPFSNRVGDGRSGSSPSPEPRIKRTERGAWPGLDVRFQRALEKLHLAFQPVVLGQGREVVGWEALVRYKDPAFDDPMAFVFAAEFLSQVPELGRRIREQAASALRDAPPGGIMFLNLHVRDLLDEQIYHPSGEVARAAARTFLEFTEAARPETVPRIVDRLAALRALGYRLSLDDVVLTPNTQERLEKIRPEAVKIDRSLVIGIARSRSQASLVGKLVRILQPLTSWIIAEGIETPEDLEVCVSLGCTAFQGFLFGRPQPPPLSAIQRSA